MKAWRENVGHNVQIQIDALIEELTTPTSPHPPPKTDVMALDKLTRRTLEVMPEPFDWCSVVADKRLGIPTFLIAKYPITNDQFSIFERAVDGYRNAKWWSYSPDAINWRAANGVEASKFDGGDCPRTNVCWFEAVAFCQWLSVRIDAEVRLPTEAEWYHAATAGDGREYPWGNRFDKNRCNTAESDFKRTTPVTKYDFPPDDPRSGLSPFGAADMAGNEAEWCLDNYENGDIIVTNSAKYRVLRGGAWNLNQSFARAAFRGSYDPDLRDFNFRFRVLCSSPIKKR